MDWVKQFQLFLFDFDGLLVDTERLHFEAYQNALEKRGHMLDWGFSRYCELAHLSADALKQALIQKFSDLASCWPKFYQEKKESYMALLKEGKLALMPGVEELLITLEKLSRKRCVATHSPLNQTLLIRSKLPILDTIPHWITREDYKEPKPSPECYLKAISLYGNPEDQIIGFEDSFRGLLALQATHRALPILICSSSHPLLAEKGNALHFDSIKSMRIYDQCVHKVCDGLSR